MKKLARELITVQIPTWMDTSIAGLRNPYRPRRSKEYLKDAATLQAAGITSLEYQRAIAGQQQNNPSLAPQGLFGSWFAGLGQGDSRSSQG